MPKTPKMAGRVTARITPSNGAAQTIATPREIGLAVDTVGSYGREVIHGVMEFCHRNPHWTIAVEPRFWVYDPAPEPEKWDVDGLIIQAYSQDIVDRVTAVGIPVMNVANMCRGGSSLPTVIPDDPAVGRMAAEYLLAQGFRQFGFCTNNDFEYGWLRGQAFKEYLTAAGFNVFECDTANQELGPWLTALPKPIAVFCCNDAWAHRLLAVIRRAGFKIPDDVAVLGVDDDELLNMVGSCPLSSISIPAAKIGYEAARLLELALNGTPPPMLTKLPPLCVVPRATTDISSVDDPHVAEALRFIKANVARPIQVDDLLDHLAISRRSLERRFRTAIGRSVALEIRRAHLERAKQLLTVTTLSIEEVSAASGFSNPTLLGVVFRKYVGQSPSAFRQRSRCAKPSLNVKV